MIPLFKSHYSIGKSILTIKPAKDVEGPDSIIDICKENDWDTLVLVEDCMTGFKEAFEETKKAGIHLTFGLRITCCNNIEVEGNDSDHKIILFAKNDEGCKLLNKIYSRAMIEHEGKVDFRTLKEVWSFDALQLAIPFYDSFIHKNEMKMSCCAPDFSSIKPVFLTEDTGLPFDELIEGATYVYAKEYDFEIIPVRSIFYKKREDYKALQTYKILCNRMPGKKRNLARPELEHFGSEEFCVESYLESCGS